MRRVNYGGRKGWELTTGCGISQPDRNNAFPTCLEKLHALWSSSYPSSFQVEMPVNEAYFTQSKDVAMTLYRRTLGMLLMTMGSAAFAGLPVGAISTGCNQILIDERPTADDVSRDGSDLAKLYEGNWWTKEPYRTHHLRTEDGVLAIDMGGSVATTSRKSEPGLLPLLPGNKNFYVEFETRLSSNDKDHWPAVWIMPIEHNGKQSDHDANDPPGFERWLEIDVDEGGFAPATHGVAISWSGKWPKYHRLISTDADRNFYFDRTKRHTFGVEYNALHRTIQWWLDGVKQQFASKLFIPEIASKHNYYLIMSAQTHGLGVPYTLYISHVFACNKK